MLSEFFGFTEEPFGATPDPRRLFDSHTHREALASLRYAYFSNRGFTALIAPPGMGKTTLLLQFLHDIRDRSRSVFVFETQCDPTGLLRYILRDLGIAPARASDEMHEQLKGVLLAEAKAGKRLVVIVDEAQNLSDEALEMLRLLTNFETPQGKLMQIVLAGQPLLADKLMKPSLEQLRQRLSTICFLEPFSPEETAAYIQYRLEQAGYRGAPLFKTDAVTKIATASQGIPRIINNLCFNALSLCCALKYKQVDRSMVAEVVADQELIRPPKEADTLKAAAPQRKRSRFVTNLLLPATTVLSIWVGIGLLSHFAHWPWGKQLPGDQYLQNAKALSGFAFELATKSIRTSLPVVAPPQTARSDSKIPAELAASEKAPLRAAPVRVTIEPNQTLHDVVVRHLGVWDMKRVREIEALNPDLTNIDHIETNQTIWLPAPEATAPQPNVSVQPKKGSQP